MECIKDKTILVADLEFKNNIGIIKNCLIYEGFTKGETPTQDINRIKEIITRNLYFMFQNRYISGKTTFRHLKSYNIHEVIGKEV